MKIPVLLILLLICFPATSTRAQNSLQKGSAMQVQPNPGTGSYILNYRSDLKPNNLTIAVSDATGKYVYLKTVREYNGDLKEPIDLAGLPKGIYFFEVEADSTREVKKIVLQ